MSLDKLKERVLGLLVYSEVLLKTMKEDSERINNNVNVMIELVGKGRNFDDLFNEYKYDRVYYNLYEGEIIRTYAKIVELYSYAKDCGVVFSKVDSEKLELLLKQEEDSQFFAFEGGKVIPKNDEVVELMKKHIAEQDNESFKEQFVREVKDNFDKVKSQAKVVGYDKPLPDEVEYEEIE